MRIASCDAFEDAQFPRPMRGNDLTMRETIGAGPQALGLR